MIAQAATGGFWSARISAPAAPDSFASAFRAAVNFQKVFYTPGTRHERTRETHVAQIDFVLRDHVPNAFVRVNPLGLQVTYFRVDQAFEESRK